MDAKVTWNGRMSFTGSAETGFELPLDAHPSVGGDDKGFRPMELMAISLAGCTAMDVISILQKKRQEVTSFETKVHAEQSGEYPKVFTHVTIEYLVEGRGVDAASLERAIELSATKYCPAQAMIAKACTIEHKYTIREAA